MRKIVPLTIATAFGLFAASALLAQTVHGGDGVPRQSADGQTATPIPSPEPVQTILTHYFIIQTALASDSLDGVRDQAVAIMEATRADSLMGLPVGLGRAAEDLARTTSLSAARQVFKRLSGYLIQSLDARPKTATHFVKIYCPMANVMWLQVDVVVNNPYFGKSMAHCGRIVS